MTAIDAFVCCRVIKALCIRLTAGASAACVWIGAGVSVSKVKTTSTLAMGFGEERAAILFFAVPGHAACPDWASGVVG